MQRFSRPIKTKLPPWHLVFVGSRPPRPSPLCGSRNPNGWRPWRCSPSSACWSTVSSSDRSVSLSAPITGRYRGTKVRQRPQRRRSCCPYVHKWHWCNDGWRITKSSRSMECNPITCYSVTRWASTTHGMKRPQHTKTVGAFRPLERGFYHCSLLLCRAMCTRNRGHTPLASGADFS